ncbi:unnamed protein product [Musa hybrid cultivar]
MVALSELLTWSIISACKFHINAVVVMVCCLSVNLNTVAEVSAWLDSDALEHLASIDLLELCNEAKVEHCRATRDLSSCGRCVQHVLNSCGHASLCEECSKRCDVCPICRTLIPSDGCRLRLRLYYKCIEVGLISKQHDDRSQEREVCQKHMTVHIERLYSLFDVALKNNLVSLICHYITDVCMNENAVSSDPVFAFLLDEVVVKDWCKETFKNIVSDLCEIYSHGTEAMRSRVSLMQKFALYLSGLSNVLEVMTSSFKETFAAQVHDLHHLLENVLKAKQHLEVMIWCTRHQFLRDVQSRFYNLGNSEAWNLDVYERKSAAIKRSWPQCSSNLVDSAGQHDNTLFIEDALSNLGIEESYVQTGVEVDISCLQDDSSGLLFLSKIDIAGGNGYPFRNLQAAADILFLRGTSDMVVAKQAIFLYYLFDRHWKRPDAEWKHIVDDFAISFGIATHSVQESLVFYLLDDHTPQALQEAINLLPEVAGPEIHPKIAQVLLERQRADVALSILRCSGRDGGLYNINTDNDFPQHEFLGEAITAVRVRIECGLLTEAFMFQRMQCSKAKDKNLKYKLDIGFSNSSNTEFWIYLTEVLVTEICHLCIRRNLVDRMIEFPWNSDEEKHLHKCLFDHGSQNPSSTCGSLLVVFYLQRYRFTEAYLVNRGIQTMEQTILESANEDVASRVQLICQWREGLIDKCLDLLPEVQRQNILAENVTDYGHVSLEDVQMSLVSDLSNAQPNLSTIPNNSSVVLQTNSSSYALRKSNAPAASPMHDNNFGTASKVPSAIQRRLLVSFESPSANMNAEATDGAYSSYPFNGVIPSSNDTNVRDMMWQANMKQAYQPVDGDHSVKFHHGSKAKPTRGPNSSAARVLRNENPRLVFPRVTSADHCHDGSRKESVHDPIQSSRRYNLPDGSLTMISREANASSWSFGRSDIPEDKGRMVGSRWRSDESSEDEEDFESAKLTAGGASATSRRRPRLFRR